MRIFNTYGPRMRVEDGRAIPAFLSQALRNEDVTVFGDGSQTRSLCYVSDLVDGIFRLMMSDASRPREHRQPARDDDPRSSPSRSSRSPGSQQPHRASGRCPWTTRKVRQPDITRARTLLGWEPKVPLDEGLRRTLDVLPAASWASPSS